MTGTLRYTHVWLVLCCIGIAQAQCLGTPGSDWEVTTPFPPPQATTYRLTQGGNETCVIAAPHSTDIFVMFLQYNFLNLSTSTPIAVDPVSVLVTGVRFADTRVHVQLADMTTTGVPVRILIASNVFEDTTLVVSSNNGLNGSTVTIRNNTFQRRLGAYWLGEGHGGNVGDYTLIRFALSNFAGSAVDVIGNDMFGNLSGLPPPDPAAACVDDTILAGPYSAAVGLHLIAFEDGLFLSAGSSLRIAHNTRLGISVTGACRLTALDVALVVISGSTMALDGPTTGLHVVDNPNMFINIDGGSDTCALAGFVGRSGAVLIDLRLEDDADRTAVGLRLSGGAVLNISANADMAIALVRAAVVSVGITAFGDPHAPVSAVSTSSAFAAAIVRIQPNLPSLWARPANLTVRIDSGAVLCIAHNTMRVAASALYERIYVFEAPPPNPWNTDGNTTSGPADNTTNATVATPTTSSAPPTTSPAPLPSIYDPNVTHRRVDFAVIVFPTAHGHPTASLQRGVAVVGAGSALRVAGNTIALDVHDNEGPTGANNSSGACGRAVADALYRRLPMLAAASELTLQRPSTPGTGTLRVVADFAAAVGAATVRVALGASLTVANNTMHVAIAMATNVSASVPAATGPSAGAIDLLLSVLQVRGGLSLDNGSVLVAGNRLTGSFPAAAATTAFFVGALDAAVQGYWNTSTVSTSGDDLGAVASLRVVASAASIGGGGAVDGTEDSSLVFADTEVAVTVYGPSPSLPPSATAASPCALSLFQSFNGIDGEQNVFRADVGPSVAVGGTFALVQCNNQLACFPTTGPAPTAAPSPGPPTTAANAPSGTGALGWFFPQLAQSTSVRFLNVSAGHCEAAPAAVLSAPPTPIPVGGVFGDTGASVVSAIVVVAADPSATDLQTMAVIAVSPCARRFPLPLASFTPTPTSTGKASSMSGDSTMATHASRVPAGTFRLLNPVAIADSCDGVMTGAFALIGAAVVVNAAATAILYWRRASSKKPRHGTGEPTSGAGTIAPALVRALTMARAPALVLLAAALSLSGIFTCSIVQVAAAALRGQSTGATAASFGLVWTVLVLAAFPLLTALLGARACVPVVVSMPESSPSPAALKGRLLRLLLSVFAAKEDLMTHEDCAALRSITRKDDVPPSPTLVLLERWALHRALGPALAPWRHPHCLWSLLTLAAPIAAMPVALIPSAALVATPGPRGEEANYDDFFGVDLVTALPVQTCVAAYSVSVALHIAIAAVLLVLRPRRLRAAAVLQAIPLVANAAMVAAALVLVVEADAGRYDGGLDDASSSAAHWAVAVTGGVASLQVVLSLLRAAFAICVALVHFGLLADRAVLVGPATEQSSSQPPEDAGKEGGAVCWRGNGISISYLFAPGLRARALWAKHVSHPAARPAAIAAAEVPLLPAYDAARGISSDPGMQASGPLVSRELSSASASSSNLSDFESSASSSAVSLGDGRGPPPASPRMPRESSEECFYGGPVSNASMTNIAYIVAERAHPSTGPSTAYPPLAPRDANSVPGRRGSCQAARSPHGSSGSPHGSSIYSSMGLSRSGTSSLPATPVCPAPRPMPAPLLGSSPEPACAPPAVLLSPQVSPPTSPPLGPDDVPAALPPMTIVRGRRAVTAALCGPAWSSDETDDRCSDTTWAVLPYWLSSRRAPAAAAVPAQQSGYYDYFQYLREVGRDDAARRLNASIVRHADDRDQNAAPTTPALTPSMPAGGGSDRTLSSLSLSTPSDGSSAPHLAAEAPPTPPADSSAEAAPANSPPEKFVGRLYLHADEEDPRAMARAHAILGRPRHASIAAVDALEREEADRRATADPAYLL